ncbi:MAG: ABC transporter ATP-binding protein [Firmicutes bacterium]|nr:ABC transporter ATP-binding protein [Candidatus Caballimonas caccae]
MEIEAGAPLPTFTPKEELLLSAKNVHKYFKNGEITSHILKGVNFDVYKGEFLCLLGESGCGKSTMLNIIGGLLDLDEGEIKFMGKDVSKLTEKELTKYRRDNIGFIFQSYNLMPNLNAKQNLDLIGELVDNPISSDELLKTVGLSDKAKNYPSELSGGQQQRIAIARAMIKRPKIILADEPTAALDYTTSIEVLSVMEEVVKNGTTLILITHNEEITKMADRVIRFRDGKTYEITINRHPLHAKDLVW